MKQFFGKWRHIFGIVGVFLLASASFAFLMFQGGFVSGFLFYSFLPILCYTMAIAFFPMKSLRVKRTLNQGTFTSGAKLTVTVTIQRASRFPLFFLVVDDKLPESLQTRVKSHSDDYQSASRSLFFPGTQRTMTYTYEVRSMPRGEFAFRELTLKTGDIFGFIQKKHTVTIDQSVLVYPEYEDIHHWHPFEVSEDGTRRSRNSFQLDTTSVASVRDYAPGDRLSWLDWKSTARLTKLVTKEFERPLNEDMVVLIDRVNRHYEGGNEELFEKVVTVAASMARYGLRRGARIGLVSLGKEKTLLPMGEGMAWQWEIFHHLAKAKADGLKLASADFKKAFSYFPLMKNMMIVSPVINNDWLRMIEELKNRRQNVTFFLVTSHWRSSSHEAMKLGELIRLYGVPAYVIENQRLNEVLKAGVNHETG